MNIIRRLRQQTEKPLPLVLPLEFALCHWPEMGTQVGGSLRYLIGSLTRSVRVSMTRATLANMRVELKQAGNLVNDELIVKRTLMNWGCAQVARLTAEGKPIALANLVLDVDPAESSEILKRCRLLFTPQPPLEVTHPSHPDAA